MPGGTLLLATLGFHEHFALRRMTAIGAGPGDYVAAVTVKPAAKAVGTAWESLRSLALKLGVKPLDLHEVDPRDFEGMVVDVIEWVEGHASTVKPSRIVFEATGGARILAVAALVAALSLSKRYTVDYYLQSETGEAWEVKISGDLMGVLTTQLSDEKVRILQAILRSPGATSHEVADATGMHAKTVMNHVSRLKKLRLVTQRGRDRGLYPTPRARLALYLTGAQPAGPTRRGPP